MTRKFTGVLAALVLVAGCSPAPAQPAPSPSPTGPVVARRYATVGALRAAAVAAGYYCPDWMQDNVVLHAAGSGHCTEGDMFSTFATAANLRAALDNLRSMDEQAKANHLETSTHLVGANWIINAPEPDIGRLAVKLGGTLEVNP